MWARSDGRRPCLSVLRCVCILSLAMTFACSGNDQDRDAEADAPADLICEPECEVDYPEGPYGVEVGETIRNHAFLDSEGNVLCLEDFRCDPSVKLLHIYATAGWCTACQVESSDLPGLYEVYHPQGLEILAAVFEDSDGNPATPEYAENYATRYLFPFPAIADTDLQVTAYFDKSTAPMNMLVNLRTMEILWLETGYNPGPLRTSIEDFLSGIE